MTFAGGSFVVNAATRDNLPYDSLKDFRGVTLFALAPLDIVASNGFKANNVKELIELAKTQPLTYATAGPGSVANMTGELFAREVGIKLQHVPYAGDAAAYPDVAAGRVDFRVGSWSDDKPHVAAGDLKLLAVIYPQKLPDAPDTPLLVDSVPSMKDYPQGVFNSIVITAKTPDDVVAKISEGFEKALNSDSFKTRLGALGLYPQYMSPADTDAFLKNQIDTWTAIAKAANIHLQ
jgi:tripartite-type tricarboxylate transporter receptor subunit TctC